MTTEKKEKPKKKERNPRPEPPPDPTAGKYKPFEQLGAEAAAEEQKEADAEKKKVDAAKAEAKETQEKDKKASLYSYIEEMRKRHPGFPDHRIGELKACKTCGEAKRIVKAWLQSQPMAQVWIRE